MGSYASRKYDIDSEGNLQLRETEEDMKRKERMRCARESLAKMGRSNKQPRMSTGGWKMVGGKSVHVYPRGTTIATYFGSDVGWMFGVVTENRVVELEDVGVTRWYTVTYEDEEEEELDDKEIKGALVHQ